MNSVKGNESNVKINTIRCLTNTSYIWIQSDFTRREATEILKKLTKGIFIIRVNLKKHLLIISYRTKTDIQHVIINVVKNVGFHMDGSENIFQNIVEMISHYMRHPILCPNLKLKLPRALIEACEPIHFNCLENLNSKFWTKHFYSKTINEILKENKITDVCSGIAKIETKVNDEIDSNYSFNEVLTSSNLLVCKPSNDNIFSVFWAGYTVEKHFKNCSFRSEEAHSLDRLSHNSSITNYERLNKTTAIWIQPNITRNEAEEILKKFENGTFIVRLRNDSKNITLSYKSELIVKHTNINIDLQNGFVIEGSLYKFHSINVLISHFMTCPIENSGLLLKLPRPLCEAKMSYHFTFLNSLKSDFWNSHFAEKSIYQICNENCEPTLTDNENVASPNDILNSENSENACQSQFLETTEQNEADLYISFEQ